MAKAKWIWYYGDYEIWHSLKLHSLRQERGTDYPCFWSLANVYPTVRFKKEIQIEKEETVICKIHGKGRVNIDDVEFYPPNVPFILKAGRHTVTVDVINAKGLPAVYVCGEKLNTDESWEASLFSDKYSKVGCVPEYGNPNDDVEKFPFSYEKILPIDKVSVSGGFLYDFGKETFGSVVLEGLKDDGIVYYGESKEEALSGYNGVLWEKVVPQKTITLTQRAFRYIFIAAKTPPQNLYVFYEYIPYENVGDFSCDDVSVKRIFDVCAYTFRLCSREFYLDGVKRDRWVWAGDAYQSFMINRYFCADDEIIKRTIIALLGKPPYFQNINTINDYSMYLIISVYDYWFSTDDGDFVRRIYNRLKDLFLFILSRLDENGFVCQAPGDWIFIDWGEMDKEGPICSEQILLYKTIKVMRKLALVAGDGVSFIPDEEALRDKIYKFFYKKELGGFIDGYVSGKNALHRQQNIFAILYDFATKDEQKTILNKILLNERITPIKTPYFKFYELLAVCKAGRVDIAQKMLNSYWSGMLQEGATTFWEEYDENIKGIEKYAMYGYPFDKSLCHAWGSGPIRILGEYIAGVRITSVGGKTFEVRPNPGIYRGFTAVVPIGGGMVEVTYNNGEVTVFSTVSGGTLYFKGEAKEIKANCMTSNMY